MIESKNSKFQYSTPRIVSFSYNANEDVTVGEFKVRISHKKDIQRKAKENATVSLELKVDVFSLPITKQRMITEQRIFFIGNINNI